MDNEFIRRSEFQPDLTNRLDPLRCDAETSTPHALARRFQARLRSVTKAGWPEPPAQADISLEQLHAFAKEEVSAAWQSSGAKEMLHHLIGQWRGELPAPTEELKEALDAENVEQALTNQYMGVLEELRTAYPRAWYTLLRLSSLRQLSTIALLRHWNTALPAHCYNSLGLSREEYALYLDVAALLGKYIDESYMKQMELADTPGGSVQTPESHLSGVEHMYDFLGEEGGTVARTPYVDVFPREYFHITAHLRRLARRVTDQVQMGKLPESYRAFGRALESLGAVLQSDQTEPAVLKQSWSDLERELAALQTEYHCPITILPHYDTSVAGDAGKQDIELRLGVVTPACRLLQKQFDSLKDGAQQLNARYRGAQVPVVPPIIVSHQGYAFGSHLHFFAPAESRPCRISIHPVVLSREAAEDYSVLQAAQPHLVANISRAEYADAYTRSYAAHEAAHAILLDQEPQVAERIGTGSAAAALEETKAEALSGGILADVPSPHMTTDATVKLGILLNLVRGSAREGIGERYYLSGLLSLQHLVAHDAINLIDGKISIASSKEFLRTLGDFGDDIMQRFYANPNATPDQIQAFIAEKRSQAESDAKLQEILSVLQSE